MISSARFRLLFLVVLCGCLLFAIREFRVRPKGIVAVDVLDIGQGDSIFITGPSGQQILVDGGPDLSALAAVGRNMSFFDRSIDLLVLSHPHLDHIFTFPEFLRRYHIGAVLITGSDAHQPRYQEFLALLQETNTPVIIADPHTDLDMGDGLLLDVLWPPPIYVGAKDADENNTSVVFRLLYGNDSMLFTGDMEEPEEAELLASGADVRSNILKVAHHGSRTSSSTGFLLAVDPKLAVISAGKDNKFHHPNTDVMVRYEHFNIPTHVTSKEGAIRLKLDGNADSHLF